MWWLGVFSRFNRGNTPTSPTTSYDVMMTYAAFTRHLTRPFRKRHANCDISTRGHAYLPCLCTAVSAARRTLSCFVCAVGCFSYLAMVSEFFWKYSEYPCSLQAPKQLSIKAFARVPGYQAVQIQSIEALTVTYILWI